MKHPPHILVVNGTKVRRPVFVLGAPHSGVELLARALGRVPGFHLTAGAPSVLRAGYAFARRPSIAHGHDAGAATVLRDAFAEGWQLTPHTCTVCSAVRVPARDAANPCSHAGEVTRFGDASPDLLHSTTALLAAFEDAACIQVIRDGRDVVAGMLDDEQALAWFRPGMANAELELPNPFFGIETDADRRAYADLPVAAKCALRWRGAVRHSARLRADADAEQLLTLRYEELFSDQISIAEKLSGFIGARVSAMGFVPDGPDGIGAWRGRLTGEQRKAVHSVARTELSRLGYQ